MLRRLFNLLTALSLLLCVVACVFWSRSNHGQDEISFSVWRPHGALTIDHYVLTLQSSAEYADFLWEHNQEYGPEYEHETLHGSFYWSRSEKIIDRPLPATFWGRVGFQTHSQYRFFPPQTIFASRTISLSYLLLADTLGLLPTWWLCRLFMVPKRRPKQRQKDRANPPPPRALSRPRRLLRILTTTLLLLCLTAWALSYSRDRAFWCQWCGKPGCLYIISLQRNTFDLTYLTSVLGPPMGGKIVDNWYWRCISKPYSDSGYEPAFSYFTAGPRKYGNEWTIHIPWWLLTLLPLAVDLLVARTARRRRLSRAAHNLCVHCGYDLRATPDRCPECGKVPDKKV